jgi:uncharacterized protein
MDRRCTFHGDNYGITVKQQPHSQECIHAKEFATPKSFFMSTFQVRVKPKSSRSAIVGFSSGVWQVALNSPPEDGKANQELLRLLAKALGVAPSTLEIRQGQKSRNKTVSISSLVEEAVRDKLESAIQ